MGLVPGPDPGRDGEGASSRAGGGRGRRRPLASAPTAPPRRARPRPDTRRPVPRRGPPLRRAADPRPLAPAARAPRRRQICTIVDKAWVEVLVKLDRFARRKPKTGVFVPALGEERPAAGGGGKPGRARRRSLQE